MENLDSRLLRNQAEEQDASRELKERKRGRAGEADGAEAGDPSASSGQADDGEPRSLRQRVQAARQALDLKERAKKKIEEKVTAPAKAGTSNILRWAWLTLIPSWGLSLIYINIHVFLKYVFGEKLFCKLGEEWLPKQVTDTAGEAGKMANRSIGLVETIGLLFLDLTVLFIILGILGLLAMIMGWIQHPLQAITDLGWSGVKALWNLFKNLL